MKVRTERDEFADAVTWTSRALPAHPAVPVLSMLRLTVEGTRLTLSGYDYEFAASAAFDVDADGDGEVLVPGRLLSDIARALPAAPVQISADEFRAVLTCGKTRFTLPTMPVEDYPTLPEMPPAAGTIASDAFADAVSQVAVAASRDSTLPSLTGVRIEVAGDTLTLVATDRYRLAVRDLAWKPATATEGAAMLVPVRMLADTAKAIAAAGGDVAMSVGTNQLGGLAGFASSRRSTTARLLDGEFPQYRALIPTAFTSTADIDAKHLAEALKRVALVSPSKHPVRLAFGGDTLTLDSGASGDAEASEQVPAVVYDGDPVEVAFNPGYLIDAVAAVGGDRVLLSLNGPLKPAVLTSKDAPGYLHLVMPVRLGT